MSKMNSDKNLCKNIPETLEKWAKSGDLWTENTNGNCQE